VWRFLPDSSLLGRPLHSVHHWWLVVVAVAIAVMASFAALAVAERMHHSASERTRHWWLAIGALSMGIGIWATHFVGMLSWHLPLDVAYDTITTLVSILPAICGSAVALHILTSARRSASRAALGGLAMAAGIGTMHCTGMEALRMSATRYHRPVEFSVSLVVAFVLATATLSLRPTIRHRRLRPVAIR
jgi:NO-binding membrane sensor protein with MHYT domain